jgi:DNA invertase Pin-like site-specific DNA recombinase
MPTAYSYIRFSSKEQEHGDSLRRQMDDTEKYCIDNKLTLSTKSYKDLGISAFKEKHRASLTDMLAAVNDGVIKSGDYIILEALDRLSRQGIDKTREITREILRKGVLIVILQDKLLLTEKSLNDLSAVIRIAVAADIGHQESVLKSKRVQDAKNEIKRKLKQGEFVNKRTVYWLKKNSSKSCYEFNEQKPVIELIINLRKGGLGFHGIASHLNNQTDYKPRFAKFWSDQTIREFIKSPVLYGAYQVGSVKNGKFIPDSDGLVFDYFPKLITFEEWKKLQPELINRTGGNSKHNHLAGIVRCSKCRGAMGKKISKKKTATTTHIYKNWYCLNNKNGSCDQSATIKNLDDIVIYISKNLKINQDKPQDNTDFLAQEIHKKETRLKELEIVLTDSDEPIKTLLSAISKIESDLNKLKNEYEKLRHEYINTTEDDLTTLLKYKDDPIKFNLNLKMLVKKIIVKVKSNKNFDVEVQQRNGFKTILKVHRKTERSDYKYMFYSSDPSSKDPALFEWEGDEFGYSDDEEYSRLGS